MVIDWNCLRPLNGSKTEGFEELCCQLAATEQVPEGSRFYRKGTPDAGVECFWRLPNGDEWGWQSKYFRESPGVTQWRQIDHSVQTAIAKHPRLTKYTICLPIDLSDARNSAKTSSLEKWQGRVATWTRWALDAGRSVEFEYWGQHEILTRLGEEKHRGRVWFWFSDESLTNEWFEGRVQEALADAGDRYSPEVNIDLPVANSFHSLGRTPQFYSIVQQLFSDEQSKLTKLRLPNDLPELEDKSVQLQRAEERFSKAIKEWLDENPSYVSWSMGRIIPWAEIRDSARDLIGLVDDYCSLAQDLLQTLGANEVGRLQAPVLESLIRSVVTFRQSVQEIQDFAQSEESEIANKPAILLTGEAGQGKTHLLCHLAETEVKESRPCLLLFGEQFQDAEPWSQIIKLLGLDCKRDEFLGALESAAQSNRCRVMIMIDAVNEGDGNKLWHRFLASMLTTLARYPWLGICISIRSSYEQYLIPEHLDSDRIIKVHHTGFGALSRVAVKKYFSHYGIQPSTPIMMPEFGNPLFLKLFCKGIQNNGLARIPSGLRGITAVLGFFLNSINAKLSRPNYLDFDQRTNIVEETVRLLAKEMSARKSDRLPLSKAREIANTMLPRPGHHDSLFFHLESEGVITVVPDYSEKSEQLAESVRFTYERFSDHLITKELLGHYFNEAQPKESFKPRRTLGKLVKDEMACWMNRGIVDALAVQIPEITSSELSDLIPRVADTQPVREAFVESLIWREETSFNGATDKYINDHVLKYQSSFQEFWNTVITLSTIPGHPLNADRLHGVLIRSSMAERDAWWSIFLHEQWGSEQAVDRLVEWAWDDSDKEHFEEEVIRLAGTVLAWFFTSSNRYLRDRSTKAMVRLFENHIDTFRAVAEMFLTVDDPYVLERLFAVGYGCAMRTHETQSLKRLAEDIYAWVFEKGVPYPHMLLRDYARGVIEVAICRDLKPRVDESRIKPPYSSEWPSLEIPELSELEGWGSYSKDMADVEWARVHLYQSVMGQDDFSRYVIGDLDEWSRERMGEKHVETDEEVYNAWLESLTDKQRLAFDAYSQTAKTCKHVSQMSPKEIEQTVPQNIDLGAIENMKVSLEYKLVRTLREGSKKHEAFDKTVKKYVADPFLLRKNTHFDSQLARRWMIARIIDIGWTVERFGAFDRTMTRYSMDYRSAHKAERIGKKYQWIAYFELLARLSDNFKMLEDSWHCRRGEYHGPWDFGFLRDLDPSNLLRSTPREDWQPHTNNWWFPVEFNSWEEPVDDIGWLKRKDNLPTPKQLIEVVGLEGRTFLTLSGFYRWEQPHCAGQEKFNLRSREIVYKIVCYLVRKTTDRDFVGWLQDPSMSDTRFPQSGALDTVFLGEYFWAESFKDQDHHYFSHDGWTKMNENVEVLLANEEYTKEYASFDCSIDESIFIELPSKFISDGMGLKCREKEGVWCEADGTVVAFDPSVANVGPGALLVDKAKLIEFLDSKGMTLMWTVWGEKQILSSSFAYDDYQGRLEIGGAYYLKNRDLQGSITASFQRPASKG